MSWLRDRLVALWAARWPIPQTAPPRLSDPEDKDRMRRSHERTMKRIQAAQDKLREGRP